MAALKRPVVGSGGAQLSEAEKQHLRHLRRLLGLPQRTPTAVVLAEAGQPPLYINWLAATARLWNDLIQWPADSLPGRALRASIQLAADSADSAGQPVAQLPWAAQLQRCMELAEVQFDVSQMQPLQQEAVQQAALQQYLGRVEAVADNRSRLRHYFCIVRPDCLSLDSYSLPAYVEEVRGRRNRRALAELRSGIHWGAEEMGRLMGLERSQRQCQFCQLLEAPGGVEDVRHMMFDCPLYADIRSRFESQLSFSPELSLQEFFSQPSAPLARLAESCRRRGREAAGLPP